MKTNKINNVKGLRACATDDIAHVNKCAFKTAKIVFFTLSSSLSLCFLSFSVVCTIRSSDVVITFTEHFFSPVLSLSLYLSFPLSLSLSISPSLAKYTNIFFSFLCRRSEFLGCISVPVKSVSTSKEINGSFKLQAKSCLTVNPPPIAMCENSQSSVDDAINIDDGVAATPLTLSKKAIHQRDADENLFLRFLELDPPIESTPAPPPTPQTSELRRKSTIKSKEHPTTIGKDQSAVTAQSHNQNGRTPFTITKKLTRTADKGFGFSIVWTHPPRIEKIETGLSAERCGILPGDYIIFVDKHNVVTMPEMDILNLIKTQGNTLVLEIFRRSNTSRPTATNGIGVRASSLTGPINATTTATQLNNNDDVSSEFATPKQSTSSLVARPMTASSNISLTLESTKRRLHLPQVTHHIHSTFISRHFEHFDSICRRFLFSCWPTRRVHNFILLICFSHCSLLSFTGHVQQGGRMWCHCISIYERIDPIR